MERTQKPIGTFLYRTKSPLRQFEIRFKNDSTTEKPKVRRTKQITKGGLKSSGVGVVKPARPNRRMGA